jgi:hypothetical protein
MYIEKNFKYKNNFGYVNQFFDIKLYKRMRNFFRKSQIYLSRPHKVPAYNKIFTQCRSDVMFTLVEAESV